MAVHFRRPVKTDNFYVLSPFVISRLGGVFSQATFPNLQTMQKFKNLQNMDFLYVNCDVVILTRLNIDILKSGKKFH